VKERGSFITERRTPKTSRGAAGERRVLNHWLGGAALAVTLALLIWAGQYAGRHFGAVEELIDQLGYFGPVLFFVVYVVTTPFGFPVSVFGFAAGALFGIAWALPLLTGSALTAAAIIYPLGHRFLRARVLDYAAVRPRLRAFVALAAKDAKTLMVLIRLSPLNFALACYLLAASGIRFRYYLLGTLLVIPSAALQAYLGYATRRLGRVAGGLDAPSRVDDLLTLIGIIAALILLIVIGNMARKAARTAAEQALAGSRTSGDLDLPKQEQEPL
jgi:uncharacterized membrane protein YdjX (TVP38/TMEM64 family)